jgi:hypothetical protein
MPTRDKNPDAGIAAFAALAMMVGGEARKRTRAGATSLLAMTRYRTRLSRPWLGRLAPDQIQRKLRFRSVAQPELPLEEFEIEQHPNQLAVIPAAAFLFREGPIDGGAIAQRLRQ